LTLPTWHTLTAQPAETEAVGARLARALPRDAAGPLVLYLQGELGAGKTTLARGLIQALGHAGAVRSPTFALLEHYALGDLTVVHLDLYRLEGAPDLEPLGLRDYALARHLWLVEWPERGGAALPASDLVATLSVTDQGHALTLTAHTGEGTRWLRAAVEFPPGST